ncbi:ParB/RepB/Spo0J family partition protein [Actinomadura sp. WMMA1423]|uniref:ParB/RepB/Spo0J family partition protein n=1 Tax=Actinomadura sp. WMMA1423 TaxID=2591108 RepID=UPI00197AC724|nr:ParB/RepB/Spo0J family partition protein [Actinomadura sp. WMMA1423]
MGMAQDTGQAVLFAGGFTTAGPADTGSGIGNELDLKCLEKLPARDVPVNALSSGVPLRRGGTSSTHVQLLNDAAGSAELPPILIQQDGCRVIDGLHRLEAARIRGDATIKARFLDCTDSEALILAMKTNSAHGLPLARADRLAGAQHVLAAHPDWSDRAIAAITGLSAKTIASLRGRSGDASHLTGKRLGRDGRRRPIAAGEGRRRAAEYISAHPDAPLRQVARETDVSLGTVHDVSARLRRGADPQPGERRTARPPAERPAYGTADMAPPHRAPIAVPASTGPSIPPSPGPSSTGPSSTAPANTVPSSTGAADTVTASVAKPTPLHRKNHTDPAPTWAAIAAKVVNDPAIRYTEGGKEFLRWMATHATDPHGWRKFVNTIPAHWHSVVAQIAYGVSKEWILFAEQLNGAQERAQ